MTVFFLVLMLSPLFVFAAALYELNRNH
jgi:hypothetical protein